jgi:sulfite oxidase
MSMFPLTRPLEMELQSKEEYLEEMQRRGGRDPTE